MLFVCFLTPRGWAAGLGSFSTNAPGGALSKPMNSMMSKTDYCVIHVFPYGAKLAGGHSNAVIAFMKSQMQQGINVQGLSPTTPGMPSVPWRSLDLLPIREMDFRAPNLCRRAMELAAGCQRPIVHFHGFMWDFPRFGWELAQAGIPYVITSQGQLHYRNLEHWAKKFLYINFVTRFFRNASGLHFLTWREQHRGRYLIPFWKKPVLMQANVVEVPEPGTVCPASREQYGIPAQAFVFAYLGRLHTKHKGLDTLVKSFARLPVDSNPCLVFIGPDWEGGQRRLERLARRLQCNGRVRFLGPQFGDRKWKSLGMADVFVSPSRWEAFGIATAEAMGFGLPIIVSSKMNLAPEWIAAGAAIEVGPSPDALSRAMSQLARDPACRQSLAEHGREWVLEHCSPHKTGARFESFYRQVLRGEKVLSRPLAQPGARVPDRAARGAVNVVHVFPYSPALSGGHANAIRSFIACQRAKDVNAVGIAPKPEEQAGPTDWGFPLTEVDSLWNLRWAAIADRFAIRPGNSLLHFHSVDYRFVPLLNDLRRAGVPYVLTSHGQLNFRSAAHWFKKLVYLNFVDRSLRKAAGLHLLTNFGQGRAKSLLPGYRGVMLVQGNLVSLPGLAKLPAGSRSDYAIPPEAFVLVFLGRLDVWGKGLDLVVEAFSCLPAERFRLVLAGPDWREGRANLELLARRIGCRERIHFVGPVYGEKKWSLLRMADVFVSPSRWEAFNIALAEAMAVGLPAVTSTKGNLAPDLRKADAALLTPLEVEPLAKAIASLEADQERRRALGRRGKAWVEANCNPDLAGPRFREFYQSILDRTCNAKD